MSPSPTRPGRRAAARLLGVAVLLAAAGGAPARTEPPASDPERLRLAHEFLVSSGGADAVRAQMRTLSEAAGAALAAGSDAKTRAVMEEAMARSRERALGLVDEMVAAAERIYADTLTATELRDAIAWNESPSGRAIRAKSPEMTRRILAEQAPMMRSLFVESMKDGFRSACARRGCSPEELSAALARVDAMFPQTSAAPPPGRP